MIDSVGLKSKTGDMKMANRITILALSLSLILGGVFVPRAVLAADATRDFITTCTYGALAGGLVGAATLAFSEDPGNKINNVARGASLGLYAGIFLGLYMMNGGPSSEDEAAAAAAGITRSDFHRRLPHCAVLPLVSERGIEGATAQYNLTTF